MKNLNLRTVLAVAIVVEAGGLQYSSVSALEIDELKPNNNFKNSRR